MNRTKIEWTDYDLGWISALIDGEGSLSLIKQKRPHYKVGVMYAPRINIANTCRELLEKAQSIIGAGAIVSRNIDSLLQLDVSSNGARNILPKIKLIAKEKQRLLLLKALDILMTRRGGRGQSGPSQESTEALEQIYQSMRGLNGK